VSKRVGWREGVREREAGDDTTVELIKKIGETFHQKQYSTCMLPSSGF